MPSPSPRASAYVPPAHPEFFVQTPVSVVRCPTLPPTAKVTYDVLLSYRDATGSAHPGQARLAAEVGVSEPTLRRALRLLASVGLVEPTRRGQGLTNIYRVHRAPLRTAERKERVLKSAHPARSKAHNVCVESDPVQRDPEERDQPPAGEGDGELAAQVAADALLIAQATGMDAAEAQATAQAAATTGHGPGYVAELVAHIEASPSVANPAGCLRALVQAGRRRPPHGAGNVPPRAQRPALHPAHYSPGGKYAHLFQRTTPATAPPLPRGPSAFEVAADPHLAGRGAEAWPRGQPQTRS